MNVVPSMMLRYHEEVEQEDRDAVRKVANTSQVHWQLQGIEHEVQWWGRASGVCCRRGSEGSSM